MTGGMGSPILDAVSIWMLSLFLVSVRAAVLLSLLRFVWSETCQHALDSVLHWVLGAAFKVCLENMQSWIMPRESFDATGMLSLLRQNHSSADDATKETTGGSSWAAHLSHESVLSSPLFTGVLCVMFRTVAPKLARIIVR